MKKKIYLLFVIICTMIELSYISNKQRENQIVCFKTEEVIKNSPEFIKAEKILENLNKQHNLKFKKMINDFQKKAEIYQEEAHLKSSQENKKRTKELIKLKEEAEQYQYTASIDITKKQIKILSPIYRKIENAILKVINKDKSIKRVDDCSVGKGVIVNRGADITNEVMKILGIKKKH